MQPEIAERREQEGRIPVFQSTRRSSALNEQGLSDSNPFFQEFHHVFTEENLGVRIRKVNNLPIVAELIRTKHGFKGQAEKAGVPLGSLVVGVNKELSVGLGYDATIARVKHHGRPVRLAFRQLHAVEDATAARRYWQGYLRVKLGPQIWTGRFYILREDGSLCAYPGKDISNCEPVDVAHVEECTVIHGDLLRQFAGKLLEAEHDDGALWTTTFALLVEEQLLFLRADSPQAKLDWVAALTVLFCIHDLKMVPGKGSGGGTVAVGSKRSRVSNLVKQGYLLKRHGSRLWDDKAIKAVKAGGAKQAQPWSMTWLVLHDDGRLRWYSQIPADASEVPNGSLSVMGAVVTMDNAQLLQHLREEEVSGDNCSPFIIRTGTRLLCLRAKTEKERKDWLTAVSTVGECRTELYPDLRRNLETHHREALQAIQADPQLLFDEPERAYSLMVGNRAGVSRRGFVRVAGQHFVPLCDAFTAGAVYDALTQGKEAGAAPTNPLGGMGLMALYEAAMGGEKKSPMTRTVVAEPLLGKRLSFNTFRDYALAVKACAQPPDGWNALRVNLGLDPFETLVHWQDSASEGGSAWADMGTVYLTDRNLFLHMPMRGKVRVVPLGSVSDVLEISGRSKVFQVAMDAGVELVGARVFTVGLTDSISIGKAQLGQLLEQRLEGGESVVRNYRLIFSKLQDLFTGEGKAALTRKMWYQMLSEITAAHRVSDAMIRGVAEDPNILGLLLALSGQGSEEAAGQGDGTPSGKARVRSRRSGVLGKLGEKVKVLFREENEGLEFYKVKQNKLHLWVGANFVRSLALMKVTGKWNPIMFCSRLEAPKTSSLLRAFLTDGGEFTQPKVREVDSSGDEEETEGDESYSMRSSRWLYTLAVFMSHRERYMEMRKNKLQEFNPNKFRSEWVLFWDTVDPIVDSANAWAKYLIWWEVPVVSAAAYWFLMSFAVYDRVWFVPAALMLVYAAGLMVAGSLRHLKEKYKDSTDSSAATHGEEPSSNPLYGEQVAEELLQDTSMSNVPGVEEDERNQSLNLSQSMSLSQGHGQEQNEEEILEGAAESEGAGLFDKVKSIQVSAGKAQAKLHHYNTCLLKLCSLHSWADPVRTKIFIASVVVLVVMVCIIPSRILWGGLITFLFTAPIRPREKNVVELLVSDWWNGLPVESSTHVNLQMAAIHSLHKKHQL